MATKALIQNPNVKHVSFPGDKAPRQRSLLKHVSLPMDSNSFLPSKRLVFASSSSVMAPPISSSSVMAPPISSSSSSSSSLAITTITTTAPTSTRVSHAPSSSDRTAAAATMQLSEVWKEIQGSNNWENLINPLHPLLRQEITRYGNLVSACYRAFDLDQNSKRYLNCKYGKKTMLREVGVENSDNYQVTKYIYATPDINLSMINPIHNEPNRARWVGYVAVSSDESVKRLGRRDIVVTFRGTVTNPEWLANFMSSLTPARLDPHNPRPDVKVESGFLSLYTSDESQSRFGLESCRQQLLSEISRLMNTYKGEKMSITLSGHSMGSSLAHLLAYDISELGLNRGKSPRGGENVTPVTVFSFAGPRVGNVGFKERCEELGVRVLRIANVNDPITKLPGVVFNENFGLLGGRYELPWSCSCYAHVGIELALDFFDVQNPSCVHDLETYINLLNRPRSSKSLPAGDNFAVEFLNRTGQMMFSKRRSMQWKLAATSVVNLLGSVSNQMIYYNLL